MLVSFKPFSHGLRCYLSGVLVLGAAAWSCCDGHASYASRSSACHYEYFIDYFSHIDENTNMDDMIDNLIFLRQSMINQGIQCPKVRELCHRIVEYLFSQRIDIESPVLLEFIERVERREREVVDAYHRPQIELIGHKKKHKDKQKGEKEIKMNGKTVFGFVSTLAGGFISIIPGCQTIGGGLIVYGISQILEGSLQQAEENEKLQKMDEQRRREEEILNAGGSK